MRKSIGHLIALAAMAEGMNTPLEPGESKYVPAKKQSLKANLTPSQRKKKAKARKKKKNNRRK